MDGTSFLKCYKKTKVLSYRSHDPAQSRWQSEVKVFKYTEGSGNVKFEIVGRLKNHDNVIK